MNSSTSVNLIKTKTTLTDEILKWALTIGRVLIIVVEIIAFSTFIYRFTLDKTLIDLHTKINQEQAIIASWKEKETTYRSLQERISVIATVTGKGNRSVKTLNDIVKLTPPGITFNNFSVEKNQVSIDSNVESFSSLTGFVNKLRGYSETSSVSVDRIENKASSNFVNAFITVKLKE